MITGGVPYDKWLKIEYEKKETGELLNNLI